ncbi:MAG: hypothetical protein ACE5R4_05980 [Armatimonadota bacterium]
MQRPTDATQPGFVSREEVEDLRWLRALCGARVAAEIRVHVGGQAGPGYRARFHEVDEHGATRMALVDVPGGEEDPFEDVDVSVQYRDPFEKVFACFHTRSSAPLERDGDQAYVTLHAPHVVETLDSRTYYRVAAGPQDIFALVSAPGAASATPARVMDISGSGVKLRLLLEATPPEALKVGADLIVRFEGRALQEVRVGQLSARAVIRRMEAERGFRVLAVQLLGPPAGLQDAIIKYALARQHVEDASPPQ